MFSFLGHCKSLTSINVSNFNTKSLRRTNYFVNDCISLETFIFPNFDTSQVTSTEGMFGSCLKLKSIDLGTFNTENVKNMYRMFYNCKSLTSINISNFNTTNVENMEEMFSNSINLEYINLQNSSILINSVNLNNIFTNTVINLIICTYDPILISKIQEKKCIKIDCSENWKENKKRIIANNGTCVDNCSLVFDTFEYDFKCYENCPLGNIKYIYNNSIDNLYFNCSNSSEGFYLADNDSLFYKPCYETCKTCDKEGNNLTHNCLICQENYFYEYNYLNYFNCYNNF